MYSLWTCLFFLALLLGLVQLISAGAPGDADPFCTGGLVPVEDSSPLPSNAVVLLDSHNYVNLLPPLSGAVWQQVDLDDNNEPGRGTEWTQSSNIPCRQIVNVCGFALGPQNNWLITQFIGRRAGNNLLPQVSMQVEFELHGCTNLECQRTFVIHEYETSIENVTAARNTNEYIFIQRVASENNSAMIETANVDINFVTNEEGFYLAIQDETTCVAINRLRVFYYVCPRGREGLTIRPEFLAPRFQRQSQPLNVTVQCVENASPFDNNVAILNCNQGGTWSSIPGLGCSCDLGFTASIDGRSCIESNDSVTDEGPTSPNDAITTDTDADATTTSVTGGTMLPVPPPPRITVNPMGAITVGTTVFLTCVSSDTRPIMWSEGIRNFPLVPPVFQIAGSIGRSILTIDSIQLNHTGVYVCRVGEEISAITIEIEMFASTTNSFSGSISCSPLGLFFIITALTTQLFMHS